MSRDYFKEGREIIDIVLEYMQKTGLYRDDLFYNIGVCVLEDGSAKVRVCEDCYYLTKDDGVWRLPA